MKSDDDGGEGGLQEESASFDWVLATNGRNRPEMEIDWWRGGLEGN